MDLPSQIIPSFVRSAAFPSYFKSRFPGKGCQQSTVLSFFSLAIIVILLSLYTWIKQICLVVLAEPRGYDGCTGTDQPELCKISCLSPYPSSNDFQQKDASIVLSSSLGDHCHFISLDYMYINQANLLGRFSRKRGCDGCTGPDQPRHGQISWLSPILLVLFLSKRIPEQFSLLLSGVYCFFLLTA